MSKLRKTKKSKLLLIALLIGIPFSANATEEIQYCLEKNGGVHFIQDGLIVVKRSPISITNDRNALYKAFIKAELAAKGDLVRELAEKHSSSITSTDSWEDVTGTRQLVDANGNLTSSEVTSKQKDTLIILENNVSSNQFSGLRKIEELFDPEVGEVCVAISLTIDSMKRAHQWKNLLANPSYVGNKVDEAKMKKQLEYFYRRSNP